MVCYTYVQYKAESNRPKQVCTNYKLCMNSKSTWAAMVLISSLVTSICFWHFSFSSCTITSNSSQSYYQKQNTYTLPHKIIHSHVSWYTEDEVKLQWSSTWSAFISSTYIKFSQNIWLRQNTLICRPVIPLLSVFASDDHILEGPHLMWQHTYNYNSKLTHFHNA